MVGFDECRQRRRARSWPKSILTQWRRWSTPSVRYKVRNNFRRPSHYLPTPGGDWLHGLHPRSRNGAQSSRRAGSSRNDVLRQAPNSITSNQPRQSGDRDEISPPQILASGCGRSRAFGPDHVARLAIWEPSERYPDPAIKILDPSFAQLSRWPMTSVERLATGMRWCEGPVYFGDARCLLWSDIPEQPHHALGRGDRAGQRVSQAVEQRQRQHPRPPGPAGHLRARQPPRHPHRIRRHHHRADRQVRRQAAQLAERRGGEVRRLDLVHRSAVRHSRQLRRVTSRRPNCRPTSIASIPRPAGRRSWPATSTGRTGSPSRPTSPSSTSSRPP